MADTFQLKIYWENRQETARECAARLVAMLEGLPQTNAAFARWNKKAMTRAKANVPLCAMPPQIDELTTIFEQGLARKDFPPGQPWPEHGFFISAWNGRDNSHGLSYMIHAGAYTMRLPYPNFVELHVRPQDRENADLVNAATITAILEQLIAAWQPLWGGVFSFTYRGLRLPPQSNMTREELARRPIPPAKLFWNPGWIVYLSPPYARIFEAPSSARIEESPDGGILVSTVDELFSSENPQHLAAADALGTALKHLEAQVRAST